MNRSAAMKNILLFIHLSGFLCFGQSYSDVRLNWIQSSFADFSGNELNNLNVTNAGDGAVEIAYPLKRIGDEHPVSMYPLYAPRNSKGDYLKTWVQDRNIFVQKFSKTGTALTPPIRVNDSLDIASPDNSNIRSAFSEDGSYIVVYVPISNGVSKWDNNMYGQIFTSDSIKTCRNFRINKGPNNSNRIPTAFFNPSDSTFWIMYDAGVPDSYKMYVQKRTLKGELLGDDFLLHQPSYCKYESGPMGTVYGGKLAVTWWAANTSSSNDVDIYARWYTLKGEPLSPVIKVNSSKTPMGTKFSPFISADEKGNCLIAWGEAIGMYTSSYIRAQLFDPDGNKIRDNFLVNQTPPNAGSMPFIEYYDSLFQISYCHTYSTVYEARVSQWKLNPLLDGEMKSSILDTGPGGSLLDSISWKQESPEGSNIAFQIRSAADTLQLKNTQWMGPDSSSSFYTISQGQKINPVHNGARFIQFRTVLKTPKVNTSPILHSVSIGYYPKDATPPAVPADFSAEGLHSAIRLKWRANIDSDVAKYIIKKGVQGGKYDPAWTLNLPSSFTSFTDTLVVTGTVYYYTISAVDSSGNSSGAAPEVSAEPEAASLYVSSKGDDRNDGTFSSPLLTIEKALDASRYGDIVMVMPGTYSENVRMKKGVKIIGSGAHLTKLVQKNLALSTVYGASNAMIKGFTIESLGENFTAAIFGRKANTVICDNTIRFTGKGEGYIPPGIVFMDTSYSQILRNFITGFSVGITASSPGKLSIRNNIIKSKDSGILLNSQESLYGEIINNTIIFGSYTGIRIFDGNVSIKNNIFNGSNPAASEAITPISFPRQYDIAYNNIWQCSTSSQFLNPVPVFIAADPLFNSPGTQNYRLKAESPCIDAGDPAAVYNDRDGSRNNIGAFGGPDPITPEVTSILTKTLSVSRISAFPGDTISVIVKTDNPAGILQGEFSFRYDPAIITYLNTVKTRASENMDIKSVTSAGCVNISFTGTVPVNITDTEFFKFRFIVSPKAAGLSSPLSILNLLCGDESNNLIYFKSVSDGMVSVIRPSSSGKVIYAGSFPGTKEDGSHMYPFSTIQKAINSAKAGDTVFVADGEFNESLDMKEGVTVEGSGAALTTLTALQHEPAVKFRNITSGNLNGFTIRLKDDYPFMGLVQITNSSPVLSGNVFDCSSASNSITVTDSSKPKFENNSFLYTGLNISSGAAPLFKNNSFLLKGGPDNSIFCNDLSSPVFEGNTFKLELSYIYASASSPVFKNNRITVSAGPECMRLSRTPNILISNNIFEDIGDGAAMIVVNDAADGTIANNLIKAKKSAIEETGSKIKIINNIITSAAGYGINASSKSQVDFNDLWKNNINYVNVLSGKNDIQADPMFLDNNYHLAAGSPCIDAGSPDILFNDRNGTRNDIGVYGGPYADLDWVTQQKNCRLRIDSINAAPDDTAELNIHVNSAIKVSDMIFSISYDPEYLSLIGAVNTVNTRDFAVTKSSTSLSSVQLSLTGPRSCSIKEGSAATILFRVKKENSAGTRIKFENVSIKDEVENLVLVSELTDGKIVINHTGTENEKQHPVNCYLAANYPNPFNPTTTIEYGISKASHVRLKIYDLLGREIMTLIDRWQGAGSYRTVLNGSRLSSGIYFYSLDAGNYRASRKLLLIK